MTFRFRLQAILQLREHHFESAQRALAEAIDGHDRAQSELRAREKHFSAGARGLQQALKQAIPGAQLAIDAARLDALADATQEARDQLLQLQRTVDEKRAALETAQAQLRTLQKVRERAELRHKKELERRQQRELDELASARSGRERRKSAALKLVLCALLIGSANPAQAAGRCQRLEGLLFEVGQERRALEERQRELEERELAIAKLETQFDGRAGEFERLRIALEKRLDELEEQLGDQVSRLAKTYAAMAPTSAAPLLESLEIDLASAIMRRMKAKKSAAVLALMSQPRARRLSRILARPFQIDEGGK